MAFDGTRALAAAFGGGGTLEDASYSRAKQRLLTAASTQAQMDKRVQEAFMLTRQNENQQGLLDNPIDLRNPGALDNNNIMQLLAAQGFSNPSNVVGALNEGAEFQNRGRLEQASLEEGFTDANAIARALQPTPQLTPRVDVKGGIGLTDQFTDQASLAEPEILKALNAGSASSSGTLALREREIARIMQQPDPETGVPFTAAKAGNIADGRLRYEQNDVTGKIDKIDTLNGTVTEIRRTGGTANAPQIAPEEGKTFYELANYATGIANSSSDLINRGLSLFGADVDTTETEAIQTINTGMQAMVRALSVNPRFPVAEQKRILEEIKIKPGFLTSPQVMQGRMRSIAESLTLRMQQAQRDADNPSLGQDIREAQSDNAVAINNFLPQLGVPGFGKVEPAGTITPEVRASAVQQLEALPGFGEMSPADQEELIERFARERQ